jgi:site-specific recombinase XerD
LATRSCADPATVALELVEKWREHLAATGYRPSTLRHYPRVAGEWLAHLAGLKIPYDRAEPEHVDSIIIAWSKKGWKPWTIRCNLAACRTWYKWLRRRHYITDNPFEYLEKMRCEKHVPNPLPEHQVAALIDGETHPLWRAMWELFYLSAARHSSVRDLLIEDLNLPGRRIRFRTWKRGGERTCVLRGKAHAAMTAYVAWREEQLEKYGHVNRWLWIGQRPNTRPGVNEIRAALRAAAARAGIEGRVYPHRLRHSTATHMLEHGADLRAIQEILGHAQLTTTEIYTAVSQKHLEGTIERTHPRA